MKQVIMLYACALFLCIFAGLVVSLAYHYSWWWLFLLCIPISLGWIPFIDIQKAVNSANLLRFTILSVDLLIVMAVLFVLAAYYRVDEFSFLGMVYFVSGGLFLLGLFVICLTIPNKWIEKRREKN
jgi:hypothetical protein